jgi:U6 snRNA m6A methyltransferase
MFGKKNSLIQIKKYLEKEKLIKNTSETQFCQGNTMRWGLAWSFCDEKLPKFQYFKV